MLRSAGATADEYAQQIEELGTLMASGWQTKPSSKTGNLVSVSPLVVVIYREDRKFLLDAVIPKSGRIFELYDPVLALSPRRAQMGADFNVQKVLAPVARSLLPGGRPLAIQSCGNDCGVESIRQLWPNEAPS